MFFQIKIIDPEGNFLQKMQTNLTDLDNKTLLRTLWYKDLKNPEIKIATRYILIKPKDVLLYEEYLKCILKQDLKDSHWYEGVSRNSNRAQWCAKEQCFYYDTIDCGFKTRQKINHPEDDKGYAFFFPLKEISDGISY